MEESWEPDIFSFVCYRRYLQAYYEAAKEHTRAFSYRYFSRRAGFKSPNFLKLIIDGQRNLGGRSVERFIRALGLREDESDFFRHLVRLDQAKSPEERSLAFEHVASMRRSKQSQKISDGLIAFLSRWYYPAIREMANRRDFRPEPEWISRRLRSEVHPTQVSEALKLLFDLGLLVEAEGGQITLGPLALTTGHEARRLALASYHRQMLSRAAASIETVASDLRDMSAITVCVSPETVGELKERIHRFKETLIELCDNDAHPRWVYQFNIQLFPLSDTDT